MTSWRTFFLVHIKHYVVKVIYMIVSMENLIHGLA